MQYTRISKIFFMVFILLSFSACSIFRPSTASGGDSAETQSSSTSKEAKGTADKSQKNLQSNICKGKIDRDGVSKLTDFVAQPTAFFCNMANKQLLALEHQHRALGNLEKETQAKQAREKISNGTMGTGLTLATMIAHTPSDEEKALQQKYLEDDASGSKKREMELARSKMIEANKEFTLGLASISLQVVNTYKTAKRASKEGNGFDKTMAALQVVKVTADLAQISALSGGLKQASVQWEINNKHLERVAGYENYAFAGDKPDITKISSVESE